MVFNYEKGDVVRKYNVDPDKPLNTQLASDIFSKKKEGPASKPIKGSNAKAFQLQTESFELYQRNLVNAWHGFTESRINLSE